MLYLIFDASNLLYRTFYTHTNEDDATLAGLAAYTALITANKYFKAFKPDKIVMCFDRTSWRKAYTADEVAVTKKMYKGTRRQKMTPKEKEKYKKFLEHIDTFEAMIRDHTSIVALAGDSLEADDLIGGLVSYFSLNTQEPAESIIVSTDQDFIQLLGYDRTRLINPADGKDRTLKDWDLDADLFMFEKCIRGDTSDNVQSALPRCKKARILRAYDDPYERANLMMMSWQDQEGTEFVVKDLFEENEMLMDLNEQPECIQRRIFETVLKGLNNPGKFSFFHFMRYLGQYELKRVSEQVDQFIPMLSR